MNPRVSVVMSVYNGLEIVDQTISSILAQTAAELEFIIVDDGSTDGTGKLLASWVARDSRIRVISQKNQGLTRALIRGCREARGEFIARQDAHDRSLPTRLEKQTALLDSRDDLSFVSCWTEYVGPEDEFLYEFRGTGAGNVPVSIIDISREHGVIDGPTSHGSVMFRRDAYQRAGGYRPEFYFGQDWDLWYRLAAVGLFALVPEMLYTVVVTPSNISATARPSQIALSRLSHAAMLTRQKGAPEHSVLAEAGTIRPVDGRAGSRRLRAASFYFIGEMLRSNGDRRAIRYFLRAITTWPLQVRAWVRLAQTLRLRHATIERGDR